MRAVGLLAMVAMAACGGTSRRVPVPVAPRTPPATPAIARDSVVRISGATIKTDSAGHRYVEADAQFMRGMIAHHGQALVMAALVTARSTRRDMRLLAERIDVSQRDEIAMMERWLRARQEDVPAAGAHQHREAEREVLMPGMLSATEMAQLTQATGTKFDSLFLVLMIRHHQGALRMVAELFAVPGAGQDPDIFRFASDVDTDQTAEIDRMRSMLAGLPAPPQ